MTVNDAYIIFMQEQKFRGNSEYTLSYYERCLKMFLDFCGSDLDVEDLALSFLNSCKISLYFIVTLHLFILFYHSPYISIDF